MSILSVDAIKNAGSGQPNIRVEPDGTVILAVYQGATPPPPTTGSTPVGTLWFNTGSNTLDVWSGGSWTPAGGGGSAGVSSFSGGTTGLSPFSPTTGVVTLGGVLSVANGGTGATSIAASPFLPLTGGTMTGDIVFSGTQTFPGGTGVTTISGGTTGLTPAAATAGAVTLAGTLSVSNGGTGATNQSDAINNLLPSQAGQGGNVLTSDGTNVSWAAAGGAGFDPGTKIVFAQAAAPTGWVQDTTSTDCALRLVDGAGGGTGGSIDFSTLFSSTSTYSGTVTITSGQVGSTTLSTAQLASHTHPAQTNFSYAYNLVSSGRQSGGANVVEQFSSSRAVTVTSAGSSTSHTHSLVGAVAGGNFTSDFAVKYVDVIICTKS